MQQTYKLKNGQISFDEEKIIIVDHAKKQHHLRIFTSALWTFFGVMSVLRYTKTGDQFLLWTGLFIGIAHFLILIITLFKSTKNEINKSEITSIEFKERFGNKFIDFKLEGNKLRRVNQIDDNLFDEVKQYIESNFTIN